MSVHKYITKHGNKYLVKLYYKDYMGKLKQKYKRGFKTKNEAKQFEIDFISRNKNACNMPFLQLCTEYINDCKLNGLREGTIKYKSSIIKNAFIPFFGNKPINQINQNDIKNWKEYIKSIHPNYSQQYLYLINHLLFYVFDYAVNMFDLYRNVARQAKSMGKTIKNEYNTWTEADFEKFIDALADIDLQSKNNIHRLADIDSMIAAFSVLFFCGLRVGELMGLTISDINNNTIRINKQYKYNKILPYVKENSSNRLLPITDNLKYLLDLQISKIPYPNDDTRIFYNINNDNLRRALDSTAALVGLQRLRLHDLRHSFCSVMISAGIKPLTLKKYMGHSKIQTTLDYYGHVYLDDLEEIPKIFEYKQNNI